MSLRSPMRRVLGLGSAKDGTGDWWNQRLTAVALVPLGLWLAWALLRLPGFGHAEVTAWVAAPANTVALLLLLVATAWHARLGVQVVIEDYIGSGAVKVPALMLNTFVFFGAAVAGAFAVLRISFGAAA